METFNEENPPSMRRVIVELADDDLFEIKAIFPMADTAEENEQIAKFIWERLG